jgi:hypothetical protein
VAGPGTVRPEEFWEHDGVGAVRTFRSPFGRALAVGMAVVAGLSVVSTLTLRGAAGLLSGTAVPAFAAVIVWALFWRPALEVSDDALTVVGVLRTTHVPWPCLTSVDKSWSLRLVTTEGAVTVWAVPVRGVAAARSATRGGSERAGDVPGRAAADADEAAAEIERRWATLADAGHLAPVGPGDVHLTVRWHLGTILALIGLGAWIWLGVMF